VRNPERSNRTAPHGDIGARLMLAVLGLIWGITWPVMKIALNEIPPLTMRGIAGVLGAVTYFLLCVLMRRSLRIPSPKAWAHVLVASLLNIVAFSLFSAFAQMVATTSRVAILAYTMPIWSTLLAWPFLGERPNRVQSTALVLCAAGLAILIYPLTANGIPLGIVFALAVGVCWGGGTVYLKWAQIEADQMLANDNCRRHSRCLHAPLRRWIAFRRRASRRCSGDSMDRNFQQRYRLCTVVHHCPAAAGGDRLARRAGIAGDRRHRIVSHARRGADRSRHDRLCVDLRGVGLRVADAAERRRHGSLARRVTVGSSPG